MDKVIIDSHAIAHSVKYNLKNLSKDDKPTGVIFGFLNHVLSIAEKFQTNKFVFAWESPNREILKRKEIYPRYKEKDEISEEDRELNNIAMPQFRKLLFDVLPALGFNNNYYQAGYEADDVIAEIIDEDFDNDWIIVSGDEDLYQLLDMNVSIYNTKTKKLFTADDFINKYGILTSEWVEIKAMGGCTSDNVSGLKGIGPDTALKYLKGELPEHYKVYKTIKDNPEQIDFFRTLVKLPFDDTLYFDLVEDEFSMKKFIDVCTEYGFKSFLTGSRFDLWRELFCGGKIERGSIPSKKLSKKNVKNVGPTGFLG